MRLSWLRALPRRFWGSPGAPELSRSFCQRPAQAPAEGGDTAGTPEPRDPTAESGDAAGTPEPRDPAAGDAPSGGTSGASAWHHRSRKLRDNQRDPRDRDPHAGDPRGRVGGDPSGGDLSGGDPPKAPLRRLRSRKTHDEHGDTSGDSTGGTTGDTGASGGPAAFEAALRELARAPPGRGGRLALVEAALAAMPALGVERSLAAYNGLLRLLPRGPWVPRGPVQRLLFPFPRQQECGLQVLEQMERYGVVPDAETRFLLLGVFGPRSRPLRKVQRMQFWLPRFRQLDPHPLPPRLPPPGLEAARLGLQRIAGEPGATVSVLQRPVPDTGEDEGSVQPYIVSCQSPEQRELLARHDPSQPVFVEGPFPLWLRGTLLSYFVLRGDPLPPSSGTPLRTPSAAFTSRCTWSWTWSAAPGTTKTSTWTKWRRVPCSPCAWRGPAIAAPWAAGFRGCRSRTRCWGASPSSSASPRGGTPLLAPPRGPRPHGWARGPPRRRRWSPPRGRRGEPGGDPPKSSGE